MRLTEQQARTIGRAMLAKMNSVNPWRVEVWENLGWHCKLVHIKSKGALTVFYSIHSNHYSAMFSLHTPGACDTRWHDNAEFKTPQAAVDHIMNFAAGVMFRERQFFYEVEKSI